ncbi:DUF3237 domain-containing protein [Alphaproteobacteria bacterium]|jgi:hypothetical protein|nr:DUF3237 domain-containing protein [Alphaproteobacteria bacterium]MDA8544551.1 DUF3237 domain-containing protein [Alphaproteobacteria bacterium]MDA8666746.1 DUF3237 domain-containing protein [Alphaproteobacteria bacterium]MDA8726248.1 DUF3237 domain-containing protein [Alphaproteobacteria bacterium]MDA8779709.1 DUF3237 domain-containing protein [Alphaproteobacteria bacterium]
MSDKKLDSEWLGSIDIEFDAPTVATTSLVVINVSKMTLNGPKLKASGVMPSGDWAQIQDNGNWKVDARLAFVTDDGEPFYCYYQGVVRMTEELNKRFENGETLTKDDIYIATSPNFWTASEKYAWLNDVICVGRAASFGGGKLTYDLYEIL